MTFNQKALLTVIITFALAALIFGHTWMSIILSATAWLLLCVIIPTYIWKRNRVKARTIFEAFKVDALGKEWVGKHSEVVLVKDKNKFEGVEVLAKTIEGSWFIVEIYINNKGEANLKKLHEINAKAAKTILKEVPKIHERYFKDGKGR